MSAYWIAHVTIHDMDQYQKYMQKSAPVFQKYQAQFIARGGEYICLEGEKFEKHVIIQFKDLQTAQACYDSDDYKLARELRKGCCDTNITLVEGA